MCMPIGSLCVRFPRSFSTASRTGLDCDSDKSFTAVSGATRRVGGLLPRLHVGTSPGAELGPFSCYFPLCLLLHLSSVEGRVSAANQNCCTMLHNLLRQASTARIKGVALLFEQVALSLCKVFSSRMVCAKACNAIQRAAYRSGGVGPLTDYMDMGMGMETTPRGSEQSVHEPLLLFIPIVHLLPKARPKHRDAKVPMSVCMRSVCMRMRGMMGSACSCKQLGICATSTHNFANTHVLCYSLQLS